MKKFFFACLAVMTIAFTSCKLDDATVIVTVKDKTGEPVANREIFYTDEASLVIGAVLPPSPTELIGLDDESWAYVETNKQGTVTFKVLMGVASLKHYFIVFDEGSKEWVEKTVTLQRGLNEEIEFEVNK
ncbi:MAG: hypothetical protein IKO26_10470 [Paludibacteraceae bacterium]|nr:hypothetical protein [Paludibacteraceae bacterium]